MSIKFILDNSIRTKEQEELKRIIDNLKKKPIIINRKTEFLKKLTLAAINTFKEKQEYYHPEIKEIKIEVPEKISLQPRIPEKLNLPLNLVEIPKKIKIPLQLYLEAPEKYNIPRELLESAPERS